MSRDDLPTLYYIHDPMCSWCYAFEPVWGRVCEAVDGIVTVKNVLGGLAPDSDVPMPEELRRHLMNTWQRIESVVPGTNFNFDFWKDCEPRRSTYPACRAVIAARDQGLEYEAKMIAEIQHAYYRAARNPSLPETLTEIAGEIGLDETGFAEALTSDKCEKRLQEELALARSLGGSGLPRLVLAGRRDALQIQYNYNDANDTSQFIKEGLAALR